MALASGRGVSLMLLPGLDGSGVLFRPLLRHLDPRIRPIVVPFPPDRQLGYEQLLPGVMAEIPRDQPLVLLGESFSGPLALMAAATRPPNLLGVILCASFVRNPLPFQPGWVGYLARPAAFRLLSITSGVKARLRSRSSPELPALWAEALSHVQPEVLAGRVRSVLQVNVTEQLRSCNVPLLYLQGERDRVVLSHNAKAIRDAFPATRIVTIRSSHWLLQTQPAVAAEAIANFVRDINP